MTALEPITFQLKQREIPFLADEPLNRHTTFRIGGPAGIFCEPVSVRQLSDIIGITKKMSVPCFLLGKGSNVLFCDEGFDGVVIHIGEALGDITVAEDHITVGAGAELAAVCIAALENSLSGMEFAYGIPGSLGGAVYMNAGAYGGEMVQVLESVTFLDELCNMQTLPVGELQLGYRTSVFQSRPWHILSATVKLRRGNNKAIHNAMQDYMERRRDKQPLEYPSAGSTFKRPAGAFAGALIDQCGLRGFRIGDAAISEKHCGFVVNLGKATCADVLAVAEQAAAKVLAQTGYVLEREVRVVGTQGELY